MRLLKINCIILLFVFLLFGGSCEKKPTNGKNGVNIASKKGMVYVPAGWFHFSLDQSGQDRKKVYLDAFYIDKYEVSNKEFGKFIKAGGYTKKVFWTKEGWAWRNANKVTSPRWWEKGRYKNGPDFPDHPVSGLSWYEAAAFAKWAGKRLPTEAEWEKASRGDKKLRFPWGANDVFHNGVYYANFGSYHDGHIYSAPIHSFEKGKSPYGCYNMLGNVWEWVADWHPTIEYLKNVPARNPKGAPAGTKRALRGGSWYKAATYYENYYRLSVAPGSRKYDDVGFRCAISAN